MSYFAIVTFDLNGAEKSPHGKRVYEKITEELECEEFYKHRHGRRTRPFDLPNNTYVAEFDGEDYGSATELTEEISKSIKRIFAEFDVKGKYFVFAGAKWYWRGGHF
jgi:hypothetical protein